MKNNTINKKEIEKFSKIAEEWWNPDGKFKPLHKFNPIRISYIRDNIIKTFKLNNKKVAIEHNGIIISKIYYKKKYLKNNDKLEIVHFIGGG